MNTENFRADIVRLLSAGEMTQIGLAKMSGVPQSTLNMFISGKTKDLSSRHIFSLWPIIYGKPLIPDHEKDQ